ncbi:hypothetical protein L1987_06363 [Smallanthus sonchifolius]|uniref:Uncharacterized protein n=1 Tax=Smallanthus sonchifolius TaxID=185202 RepID=A0ACB9JY38_9ASTR|nr:hypothetical protein L1987_06363 [Smallanthus sonchifolius]
MVLEDDQQQDKPTDGGLNSAGDMSDYDDKISGFDTEVVVEKHEQLEEGEEHNFRSPSPSRTDSGSSNGGNREYEADDVMEGKLSTEGVSVTKIEPELLPLVEDEIKTLENQKSFLLDPDSALEDESGTEEEQVTFMKELETFHKERCLEFKPPRFYGEPLNCLKLWRSVIRHGGYEQVTSGKVWRQVGESFNPPKTYTTVSWTFRCFYEKALLEYEKYKMSNGDLPFTDASFAEPVSGAKQTSVNQTPGSGRARRDAAARVMQGWHSQRLLGNGEVGDPIIKDKTPSTTIKREKQGIGLLKRKKPSPVERAVKLARMKA